MRILIAEDDQVLADGLLRTLRGSGAVVDHVASGSEADTALLTNNEFDLLILDLGLPRLHGLEVLKRLRAKGVQHGRKPLALHPVARQEGFEGFTVGQIEPAAPGEQELAPD